MNMEDNYKLAVCQKVEKKPLLWNPEDADYKNNYKRLQVWMELEKDIPPYRPGVTVKDTWNLMKKAYACALLRRNKKKLLDNGATIEPWKFEKAMSFIRQLKAKQTTTYPDPDQVDDISFSDVLFGEEDNSMTATAYAEGTATACADDDNSNRPTTTCSMSTSPQLQSLKRIKCEPVVPPASDDQSRDRPTTSMSTSLQLQPLTRIISCGPVPPARGDQSRDRPTTSTSTSLQLQPLTRIKCEPVVPPASDDHSRGRPTLSELVEPTTSVRPSLKRKVADDSEEEDGTSQLSVPSNVIHRRIQDRNQSLGMKFFESVMPQVAAIPEDRFLDFQIGVLGLIKRSQNRPVLE